MRKAIAELVERRGEFEAAQTDHARDVDIHHPL